MQRAVLFLIVAAVIACEPAAAPVVSKPPAAAPAPAPDVAFPSSPAGAAATAWLDAVNEGSYDGLLAFYRAHFAPALNANHEDEGRSYDMAGAHASDGRQHLRAIEKATDTNIVAIYERACGLASRAYGVANNVDTKFNLGSMNKMFTAVSIAQLVDAGKLKYDDTLAKVWPEYPNRAVAEKITVRQLLTHTSGLGDYFSEEYDRASKDRFRAIKDYLPLFAAKPLQFEPGSRFAYSNAGFMVLGGVVQRVSGQDYFDYVRAHVYVPAGMKSTDAYEMDHDTPNLAIGYTVDRQEPSDPIVPGKMRNNLFMNVVKGGPAGGGFSTVGDLIRFGDAFVRGKLVSPAQVTMLTTPHAPGVGNAAEGTGYGYGFGIEKKDGQRMFGHNGGFFGLNAQLLLIPETGLSVAALASMDLPSAERMADRARQLFARVPRSPAPSAR